MERKLHVGGEIRVNGWEVLNAMPGPHVDHIGQADDLSRFEDDTFDAIYGSHVVEHIDYKKDLQDGMLEWHRVLKPGGKAYISVPDMDVLCQLFLNKQELSLQDRFMVMRMMFGGHINEHDYHLVGLNEEILAHFMREGGFSMVKRVPEFGIFKDTSSMRFAGVLISLNLIGEKATRP